MDEVQPRAEPGPPRAGLTSAEAGERLAHDGPNEIHERAQRSRLSILLAQLRSPLVILLILASVISIAVGDEVDAGIILVIVVLSALLGFVQEARSEEAVAALRARLALKATVFRDSGPREVLTREIVRGDLVDLHAGDVVPADGRLVEVDHLHVDESAMTGESAPALKSVGSGLSDPVTERRAFAFFGTSVVSGAGRMVVTATRRSGPLCSLWSCPCRCWPRSSGS